MIDPGRDIVDLLNRNANITGKLFGSSLYRVAQSHSFDLGGFIDRPGQHRHRVDIVEQSCIRAKLFHIAAHLQVNRDCPQSPHDSANAEGIRNGLIQTIFLRHFEIDDRTRFISSDLEHSNRIVCTI